MHDAISYKESSYPEEFAEASNLVDCDKCEYMDHCEQRRMCESCGEPICLGEGMTWTPLGEDYYIHKECEA